MQQFTASNANMHQQLGRCLQQREDAVIINPSGLAWFDQIPIQPLLKSQFLTVVVYPNHGLMEQHLYRLGMQNLLSPRLEAFVADMPPHQERALWQKLQQAEVSVLLLTERKLQHITTLSQLISLPRLGLLIVEQGHLAVPHLWGMRLPYAEIPSLFQERWPTRPPMLVCAQPLPPQYLENLTSTLGLKHQNVIASPVDLEPMTLCVERFLTEYQKVQALRRLIKGGNVGPHTTTVILCHSFKAMTKLEAYLAPLQTFTFHPRLEMTEKLIQLIGTSQEADPILLVDSAMLNFLPLHMLVMERLRLVHWQLPWSCEALMQQSLPYVATGNTTIETTVLFTKEDYLYQKRWLSYQFSGQERTRSIYTDHLNRVRSFCNTRRLCRKVQLQFWLSGELDALALCGQCDVCHKGAASSLWSKLVEMILY